MRAILLIVGALAAMATGAQAQTVLKMDAATQARLGVRTATLAAAESTAATAAFARGLDLTPLATLDADLTTAVAAARASGAEAKRTAALAKADATVSRKTAEAAAAQARGDQARLALLRRRVGLEWGPGLAKLSDARRERLVAAAAAGRAALVRIDRLGLADPTSGATAELDLGPHGRVRAERLGPARTADPRATAPGVLALVTGPAAAWVATGVAIPASFPGPGAPAGGVLIPREALLRTAGATYAYVRRGSEGFERRPVVDGRPQAGGLFAPSGFKPGEAIVVQGAAMLLAAEHTPPKEG